MPRLSKYDRLKRWLVECGKPEITLSFARVEEILGFALPDSAYRYDSWWANSARGGSQIRAWRDAGWRVEDVDRARRQVTLRRVSGAPMRRMGAGQAAGRAEERATGQSAVQDVKAASRSAIMGTRTTAQSMKERTGTVPSPRAGSDTGGRAAKTDLLPAEGALDASRLPPRARRLLELRARRHGRQSNAELAHIVASVLAAEDRLVRDELRRIREGTRRPGGFDALALLGRKGRGER